MQRNMRTGRDEFAVDPDKQQEDSQRYGEGKGLIGGDPARRPEQARWRPIPEDQRYFRLIDIGDDKRARLGAFLQGPEPLEIEIGFGTGEFLLGRAAANPTRRFLGFEVKRNLCRQAVGAAQEAGLDNLWIGDDDARWALPQLGLVGRVAIFHVLYPDPWWKRKHHAKRLFRLPFVELVHDLLVPGGLLHIRSDVEGYIRLIDEVVAGQGGFGPHDPTLAVPFDADPPTRREAYCREIERPFWVRAFRKMDDGG